VRSVAEARAQVAGEKFDRQIDRLALLPDVRYSVDRRYAVIADNAGLIIGQQSQSGWPRFCNIVTVADAGDCDAERKVAGRT